jgi:hypothetical protein
MEETIVVELSREAVDNLISLLSGDDRREWAQKAKAKLVQAKEDYERGQRELADERAEERAAAQAEEREEALEKRVCPNCGGTSWGGGTDADPRPWCNGCGEPQPTQKDAERIKEVGHDLYARHSSRRLDDACKHLGIPWGGEHLTIAHRLASKCICHETVHGKTCEVHDFLDRRFRSVNQDEFLQLRDRVVALEEKMDVLVSQAVVDAISQPVELMDKNYVEALEAAAKPEGPKEYEDPDNYSLERFDGTHECPKCHQTYDPNTQYQNCPHKETK